MNIEKDEKGQPMDIECHEYSTDECSDDYYADYKWVRIPDRWSYDLLTALKCMRNHPNETGMNVGFVDDIGRSYEDNDEMQKFFKYVQDEHSETLDERQPSFPKNGVLNINANTGNITPTNANEIKIRYSITMDKNYHLVGQSTLQHADDPQTGKIYPKATFLEGYALVYIPDSMLDIDKATAKLDKLFSNFKNGLGNQAKNNGTLKISFEFLNRVHIKGLSNFDEGNNLISKKGRINVSNFDVKNVFRKCYKRFAKQMENVK